MPPPPEMGAVGAETGVVDCGVLEIDTPRLLEGAFAFGLLISCSSAALSSSSEESRSSSSIAAAICSDVIDIEN